MSKNYLLFLLVLTLLSSNQAFAACTSPAGAASQTRYDFGLNKMYYCNDTDWIESGGVSSSVSMIDQYVLSGASVSAVVISMTNNKWPDYIVCDNNSATNKIIISLLRYKDGTNVLYAAAGDATNDMTFNVDGSYITRSGVSSKCGASGSSIDSICDDNRCGFF